MADITEINFSGSFNERTGRFYVRCIKPELYPYYVVLETKVGPGRDFCPVVKTPPIEAPGITLALNDLLLGFDADVKVYRPVDDASIPVDMWELCFLNVYFAKAAVSPAIHQRKTLMVMSGIWPKLHVMRVFQKALAFETKRKTSMNNATWLYRNMLSIYFEEAKKNGMLHKRLKDGGGDPHNPINKRLEGVFFSANVDNRTKQPPSTSPFGPARFSLRMEKLLQNLGIYSIFFADFYCMRKDGPHYATLVICKYGSDAYKFCERYLMRLPPYKPFLHELDDGRFLVSSSIWVDLFITEDIDINDSSVLKGSCDKRVESGGSRVSDDGIPKYRNCPTCNVLRSETWNKVQ